MPRGAQSLQSPHRLQHMSSPAATQGLPCARGPLTY